MNGKQKKKLLRNTLQKINIAAVIGSIGYLVIGTANVIMENRDQEQESVTASTSHITIPADTKSREFTDEEEYLLAKIAMAEAEGEDVEGKALVICVVLNRVDSKEFPDGIESVIYEHRNGVWQFPTVKNGGRWHTTDPDEECWNAIAIVEAGWDESEGALYFEGEGKSEWHRKNLELLFQHGNHCFYREKE